MKPQYTVLEVLFPQVRAEILRLLFLPPHKERYVRELMGLSGLALSTIQEELRRLSALGLVSSRSNRFHRFYRANSNHGLFTDLVHIATWSEKMPLLKHSAVHRQRNKHPRQNKLRQMRPERPIQWNLFSKKQRDLTG